ncbi:MAG: cytochrome c, partial [Myxococcales bacterium]
PRSADLYAFLDALPATRVDPVPFTVVASVQDVPTGDVARGEALYGQACQSCHGTLHEGAGRLRTASRLPEDTIAEHAKYGAAELRLTAIEKIRHGLFLDYGGRMPPFSTETLSDQELGDVLQYLGFLPPVDEETP